MLVSREEAGILRWSILHRSALVAIVIVSGLAQNSFDSSAWIQLRLDATQSFFSTLFALPLLRWDSLHFLASASPRPLPLSYSISHPDYDPRQAQGGGFQLESSLAFQPGIIWLLRILGCRSAECSDVEWNPSQAIILTSTLSAIVGLVQPTLLFRLTLLLTGNMQRSKVAAYLSILSPSPCTLISPTPEAFFSFFAILGHLCLASFKSANGLVRLFMASICYALATTFRANGILLVGFIVWNIFWQGDWPKRLLTMILSPVLVFICLFPLLLSQAFAYARFCLEDGASWREWCGKPIPTVYTFVQDHYWNVGFFRYWTVLQLPNWILSLPVLGLAGSWIWTIYSRDFRLILRKTFIPWKSGNINRLDKFLPHAHFTFITLLILVFNSHIQVALRFASPGGLPAVWWGASSLFFSNSKVNDSTRQSWANLLLIYLVLWNLTSSLLYSGFYPPA